MKHRNRHGRQQRTNRIGTHTGRKMAVPQAIPDALCNGVNTSGHKNDPFSGRFLCIARAEKDMTQGALAEAAGVSRQTINAIEKGEYNPTINLCRSICKILGKTLDELFWEE